MEKENLTLDDFLSRFQLLRPQVNREALNQRQAAVLIPVVRRAQPGLRLTQRSPHLRKHAGQVAFIRAGIALVEQTGHGQAEHGIAEELQALVVVGAMAAMRDGPHEQLGPLEAVAESSLQVVQRGAHRVSAICPGT